MGGKTVTILCSGVALGVYIPALLVNYQLARQGAATEVVVLENLLKQEKQARILENKKAFHQNFRVALTGQKMARDLWPDLDDIVLEQLFGRWQAEKRLDFIVFSGFWMPVLMEYRRRIAPETLAVDIVHMDADVSASWKGFQEESRLFDNIWLFNGAARKLDFEIRVTGNQPVPYDKRPERYVIHGGGWGMGTYQSKIPELEALGIDLDIVAYDPAETQNPKPGNRYFMMDPGWSPWVRNADNLHEFPPFAEIKAGRQPIYKNRPEYHELFEVIRTDRAIISKPGGATLVDSLAAATPIVMLDPFGGYERRNAELWGNLGFGIPFVKWQESGYSQSLLETMHRNLLRTRGSLVDYPSSFLRRKCSEVLW